MKVPRPGWTCDMAVAGCCAGLDKGTPAFGCRECNFDVCQPCFESIPKAEEGSTKVQPETTAGHTPLLTILLALVAFYIFGRMSGLF